MQKKATRVTPSPSPATVPGATFAAAKAARDGVADSYLAEVLAEGKATGCKRRRSVRATVWRPHLQSIVEEDAHE
ncbi:hypothetical protein ABZP36_018505 [Zizania latifolia]